MQCCVMLLVSCGSRRYNRQNLLGTLPGWRKMHSLRLLEVPEEGYNSARA